MSPATPPEVQSGDPSDEPADDPPRRRPIPPGLLVAGAFATAVLVIAIIAAVRAGGSTPPPSGSAASSGPAAVDRLGGGVDLTGQALPAVTYTTFDSDTTQTVAEHYEGKPLVINFWSSTCAPCVTEMPAFQQVHERVGDQVAFLGLDVTDSVENGQNMLDKTKVRYDVGRDPQGDALVKLGGSALPTTVLVGADGTVKLVHVGAFSADDLTAAIATYLPPT
jgi:thiol-disulfide isomerase/thioredoxin